MYVLKVPPTLLIPKIAWQNLYRQRCKNKTFLHEQGLSQNNFTQKSALIATNLIRNKTGPKKTNSATKKK